MKESYWFLKKIFKENNLKRISIHLELIVWEVMAVVFKKIKSKTLYILLFI